MSSIASLFKLRIQESPWHYAIAAVPFLILALASASYLMSLLCLVPVAICTFQYKRPTVFGWFVIFILYLFCTLTLAYSSYLIFFGGSRDTVWALHVGGPIQMAIALLFTIDIYRIRPDYQ